MAIRRILRRASSDCRAVDYPKPLPRSLSDSDRPSAWKSGVLSFLTSPDDNDYSQSTNYDTAQESFSPLLGSQISDGTSQDTVFVCPEQGIEIQEESRSAQDSFFSLDSGSQSRSSLEHRILVQEESVSHITHEILRKRSSQALDDFGGVERVAAVLSTNVLQDTRPSGRPCLALICSVLTACKNCTVVLLFIAAFLSLVFGIKERKWFLAWLDGVVFMNILILTIIKKVCAKRKGENVWQRNIQAKVDRNGVDQFINEVDVVVGDMVVLGKGDIVPADGLLVPGTGTIETDDGCSSHSSTNQFLFYGSKVIHGTEARMLAVSTGANTEFAEMMSHAMKESVGNNCIVESSFHKVTSFVYRLGIFLAIIIIIKVYVDYKINDKSQPGRLDSKAEPARVMTFIDAMEAILHGSHWITRWFSVLIFPFIMASEISVFVIFIANHILSSKSTVLMVSLTNPLAYSKMASITTICTDKFKGLTEGGIEVEKFFVGEEAVMRSSEVASNVREDLCHGIGPLSLQEHQNDSEAKLSTVISWAEARLGFKKDNGIDEYKMVGSPCERKNPFHECCQFVVKKNGNTETTNLYCIGPLQDIFPMCSVHYCVDGSTKDIDRQKRIRLVSQINESMGAEQEGVIAFACKRISDDDGEDEDEASNLTLIAVISIKEIRMDDIRQGISSFREGGIRMVITSGDNIETLRSIGENCGILAHGCDDPSLLSAETFRNWSKEEKMERVAEILVMGNCLPSDKIEFIQCLREKGELVAQLGQTTRDVPALKHAHIGLAVETRSSHAVRENADIIICSGNCFLPLEDVILKGRWLLENMRKFTQLQLVFLGESLLINFLATVIKGDAPLTEVELFFFSLFFPLFGGLALLTGPGSPTQDLIRMQPLTCWRNFLTMALRRNIGIQIPCQTSMFLILLYKGQALLGTNQSHLKLTVYIAFFICQVFNTFLARELEKKNIFRGLIHRKSVLFWVALFGLIIWLVLFVIAECLLSRNLELNWKTCTTCAILGIAIPWLLDLVGKTIHDLIHKMKMITAEESADH